MVDHSIKTKVVVIGGGYAGTMAANHLRARSDIAITVINARSSFVERIRLHQLVAGTHEATADYGSLLGDGIRLVVGTATRIDSVARVIEVADGPPIDYDYAIYAVGSTSALPTSVAGARDYAHPIADVEHARRLRDAISATPRGAPITVVGAGLTGIETAAELAEQGRAVTLICGGQLGPYLSASGRRAVARVLGRLQVRVREHDVVRAVRPDAVVLGDGSLCPSAVTIWTTGFDVPALAAASGLQTDAKGRLLTDETLTSVDDARLVAAGDCACPSGVPLRMSCQSAEPMGTLAARTVLSRVAGTPPPTIDQAFLGACISLGRASAVLQFAHTDDRPVNYAPSGRAIAAVKELVCRSTLWSLRREARRPGAAFWFRGGSRPAPSAVVTTRAVARS